MAKNEIDPHLEDALYGDVCHIIDGREAVSQHS